MPEHESFIFWYAKEQGWDKDEGWISRSISSRPAWISLKPSPPSNGSWAARARSPSSGALRYNTYLIGIANDESWVNAVTVRPDNPALKVKGWNPEYPEPPRLETVKGRPSSAVLAALRHVRIPEGPRPHGKGRGHAVWTGAGAGGLRRGLGDFAGIWPMWLYIGMERGNKLISPATDAVSRSPSWATRPL